MAWTVFLLIPALIWTMYRVSLADLPFDFDFGATHATFSLIIGYYLAIARGVVVVDLAAALYAKHHSMSPNIVLCCLAGAAYGFALNVWLPTTYEKFLHQKYPRDGRMGTSNYTLNAYAMTRALGWGAAIFTVVGVVAAVLT